MPEPRETVITSGRGTLQYWHELWEFRDLFWYLAWRDVLVRYKQTVIGVAWALLRPLLTMAILTVVFGVLAKLPSDGIPYAPFVLAALLPWQLFANAVTECSGSLVANSNLLTKVYFPRLIIPASALAGTAVDGLVSFLLLLALVLGYGLTPGWRLLALPVFLAIGAVLSFGFGIVFAALNARYRDVRIVVPFVVQIGLYVSPVGYASSVVPAPWRWAYSLNPLVGLIDGFRWALLGGPTPLDASAVAVSIAFAAVLLILGTWYFRATERVLADVI